MSAQLAHAVAQGFNRQAAMLSLAHADSVVEIFNDLRNAKHEVEEKEASYLRRGMAASYGYYEALAEDKPFAYADGIAFIPITGLLINRFSCSWSWVTGYNFIREQLNYALQDSDVKLIVFDVHSGGGQVAGCFELADDIFASRAIKPSVAVVDSSCYSAAYALASSASKVVAIPSGGIGSIGVLAMHVDMSKALEQAGYKVTLIQSGTHKTDGNPYQALPASVKADIQKSVDANREEFVALVVRNRGLERQAVYDTEAQTYSAQEALQLGLIDAIARPIEAVSAFLNELSGSETTADKEEVMSQAETKPGAESTAATPDNAATAATTAPAASADVSATAQADARTAERQRVQGILNSAEGKDRPALANHLALNTDMSVEEAVKVMSVAAVESKATSAPGTSAFAQAMDKGSHPDVGAGAEASAPTTETVAERILKAQGTATGAKK